MKKGTFFKLVLLAVVLGANNAVHAESSSTPKRRTGSHSKKSKDSSFKFLSPEVESQLEKAHCDEYLFNLRCDNLNRHEPGSCSAAHRPMPSDVEKKCAAVKAKAEKRDPAKFGIKNVKKDKPPAFLDAPDSYFDGQGGGSDGNTPSTGSSSAE
jgi:hypothetical protein